MAIPTNQLMYPTYHGSRPTGAESVRAAATKTAQKWGLAEWFVIGQTAIPALLYLPGSQAIRLPIRMAAFLISLAALLKWRFASRAVSPAPHPAQPWLLACVALLTTMIFHPATNSVKSGIGHVLLYLTVLAPCLWAPAFVHSAAQLKRILIILLVCNGINALVGVLQVYDPDRWMPPELSQAVLDSRYR